MRSLALVPLAILLAACGGPDEVLPGDASPQADAYCPSETLATLRNPHTGECEEITDAPICGPGQGLIGLPDWAECSACAGRDRLSCLTAHGCRAIYVDLCPDCDVSVLEYGGCWGTAPSGPVQGGGCGGLDAHECSRHDDCAAMHLDGCPDPGTCEAPWPGHFSFCFDEPPACCEPGEACPDLYPACQDG
jgi:hypothetical protein